MAALVIAEHDNQSIKGATLNTVTAALACGGDVHVLVAGHNAGDAAQAAGQIAGVAKVLHAEGEYFAHGLAENVAAQVLALAANYSHILFPATASGKNVAPRVAAKLDVGQISDVTKVISADTFERPIYAGNAIATVQSGDSVKVLTVRTTGFDAAAASGGSAAVESVGSGRRQRPVHLHGQRDRQERPARTDRRQDHRQRRPRPGQQREVPRGARRRWPTSWVRRWAPAAPRWMPATRPTTGRSGRPARSSRRSCTSPVGISGAIQHLAGMKDSKVIVAINKDAEAPIFSVADYGLEADLFTAVPELVKSL